MTFCQPATPTDGRDSGTAQLLRELLRWAFKKMANSVSRIYVYLHVCNYWSVYRYAVRHA